MCGRSTGPSFWGKEGRGGSGQLAQVEAEEEAYEGEGVVALLSVPLSLLSVRELWKDK